MLYHQTPITFSTGISHKLVIDKMLTFFLLCLAVTAYGQSTTNVESEDDNANPQPTLYNPGQTYSSYQPAAQQRRPVYAATVPRAPDTYSYAPYSFNYVAQGEDGSSSRQETGDASGRVVGSYTLAVEDGRKRVVEYVADQDGFRATIDTNEPGTEIQNPADVVFHSAGLGRANTQGTVVSRPVPPQTAYRPRPSRIYTQPAVVRPVYHREEVFAPYRHYYGHGHNDDHGHNAHGSYYHNDHRYYWGH